MLNNAQKDRLLWIARKTLADYLAGGKEPELKETDADLIQLCGAFVTLSTSGRLRGCIGYIQAVLPLYQTISKMAIEAATGDPRFPEVTAKELNNINIEISVLTPLKLINNINEVEVGKHGLLIEKGFYFGLLLPQVAIENKWDKYQFLDQTCIKAGLDPGDWKEDAKIYIFSAQVFRENS